MSTLTTTVPLSDIPRGMDLLAAHFARHDNHLADRPVEFGDEHQVERIEIMRARLGDSPSAVAKALKLPYEFVAMTFEALDLVVDTHLKLPDALRRVRDNEAELTFAPSIDEQKRAARLEQQRENSAALRAAETANQHAARLAEQRVRDRAKRDARRPDESIEEHAARLQRTFERRARRDAREKREAATEHSAILPAEQSGMSGAEVAARLAAAREQEPLKLVPRARACTCICHPERVEAAVRFATRCDSCSRPDQMGMACAACYDAFTRPGAAITCTECGEPGVRQSEAVPVW